MKHFNEEQNKALCNLFGKFYHKAFKIILMAKTARMAVMLEEHTGAMLEGVEISEIFMNIEDELKYIFEESAEMSTVPDYLFWEKRAS